MRSVHEEGGEVVLDLLLEITTPPPEATALEVQDAITILGFILGSSGLWAFIKWRQERKDHKASQAPGYITANTDQWERLLKSVNTRVQDLEQDLHEVRQLVDYLREVKTVDDQHNWQLERHIYDQKPPPPPPKPRVPHFDAWRKGRHD